MARHFFFRQGKRGSATLLGLYGWNGTGTPAFLGDTYDGRFGKTASYIPAQYSFNVRHQICPGGDVIPLFSVAPGGRYLFHFRAMKRHPEDPGEADPPATQRWLFYSDGTAAPMAVATNASVQNQNLCALLATDSTFYGIATGASSSRVWSSTTGSTWTQGSAISGMPLFEVGEVSKTFEWGGDVFCFRSLGIFRNTANDLVAWDAKPLLVGYSDSVCYHDVAFDGTAIVVIGQGVDAGVKYNVILRSTDGNTFTEVRKVQQSLDTPMGFAFDLEWRQVVAFGTGFCIYGANPFSGSLPYVLKSTDHGATFTMSAVTPTAYPLANVSGYAGAGKLVAAVPIAQADGTPYPRLRQSSDGIDFTTAITF